jgi:hypothetical protein
MVNICTLAIYNTQVMYSITKIIQVKVNPLKTKRRLLYLKPQLAPRSKAFHLGYKKPISMLYGTEVAVCSEINTKQINTVWAECQFSAFKPVAARNR